MKREARGSVVASGRSRIAGVFVLVAVIALGGASETILATEPAAAEWDVEMPDYVVVGERPLPRPQSWRYVFIPVIEMAWGDRVVVAPGFEILSNLSVQNTRVLVAELQRRQLVGAILWPVLVKGSPYRPLTVVIDRDQQAVRTSLADDGSRPLGGFSPSWWRDDPIVEVPRASGAGGDSFGWIFAPQSDLLGVPSANSGRSIQTGSPRANVTLWGDPPFRVAEVAAGDAWAGSDRPSEELLAAEISEQTALLALTALAVHDKPWLRVGLGRLIATTQVGATEIEFAGQAVTMSGRYIPELRMVLEKSGRLTPAEADLAAAFVHYGLYGHNGKYALRFIQLVERLETEPLSERVMKETMGKSLRRMDAEVRGFTRSFAHFRSIKYRGRLPEPLPAEVREATQAEVARLQARLWIGQERPDLALNGLRIAYRRGEREIAMLALLAELEASHGSLDRAERIVAAVMEAPQPPLGVFLQAGRIALQRIAGDAPERQLDAGETARVLHPLARGVREGHGSEELWTFLAEVVLRSAARPHESIAGLLDQAATRYPQNVTVWKAAEVARARSSRE